MKKAYIVIKTAKKRMMLKALGNAGLLHLESDIHANEETQQIQKRCDTLLSTISAIVELQGKREQVEQRTLSMEASAEIADRYAGLIDERKRLEEEIAIHKGQVERLSPWGDFDPVQIEQLRQAGIDLHFYTLSKKDLSALDPAISYLNLAPVGSLEAIATVGVELPPSAMASELAIPKAGLLDTQRLLETATAKLAETVDTLRGGAIYLTSLKEYHRRLTETRIFEEIANGMEGEEELCWIGGYLPIDQVSSFETIAKSNAWAYALDDVSEEDTPPTLVRYPKGVGIIKPVFDILGTVPGYSEGDISTWFLLFFTLFFAMIIGDAGYGLIFLLAASAIHFKTKKPTTLVLLIYVLSVATMVWGSITGTWFGSKAILERLPVLQTLVIPSIANYPELFGIDAVTAQNTVMKFCFIVGTVQLSLACTLNVIKKAPHKDLSLMADIGWLVAILALYLVVLQLVIGTLINIQVVFTVVLAGFALVVLFGEQSPGTPIAKGMIKGLGGIFTTFLNTISAFSNIMSYIRLFAVGMASVAIAQSFNAMASSMNSGIAIVAGIVVLVIGHSLNLVMGLLSVVVHGVRLNLLEFSGQLGMEWTGVAYKPFAQTAQEQ
ncbi:MAG: ATPase [Sphaerochaeta sp.]|nr:ATPase [Sphaerochaeta sp.]